MSGLSSADDEGMPEPISAAARMTVDEFLRRAGSVDVKESGPVELLEGRVVPKARQTLRHDGAVDKIQQLLLKLLPSGWLLRIQQLVVTTESLPEPDVAVVSAALDGYAARPPQAEEVALVIEVADASLTLDRRLKGRVYARAGILNYWVLDLIDRQLEAYSNPSGPVQMPGYLEQRVYRLEDKLSLVIGLDDLGTIRVADLIP